MDNDTDFSLYKQIHTHLRESTIWTVARIRPECLPLMKLLARLCCQRIPEQPLECLRCGKPYVLEIEHLMSECNSTNNYNTLHAFLDSVKSLSVALYDNLKTITGHGLIMYVLGKVDDDFTKLLAVEMYLDFLILCAELCNTLLQN